MNFSSQILYRRVLPIALSFCICGGASALQGPPSISPAGTSNSGSPDKLSVVEGRSMVLDCAEIVERVSVGRDSVADATVVSPREILVSGKAPGETTLILWQKGGSREFFTINVQPNSDSANTLIQHIRRLLAQELPGQNVKVSGENGSVFLTGTVKDLNSSQRATEIASVAGKVVNLLYVNVPSAEPQIMLKVIFASVDRTRSKQLGINLFSTGLGNTIGGINTGQFSPPSVTMPAPGTGATASLSNELNLFAFFPGLHLGATIQALESQGLVQVLAEPNILTENGKRGTLLAGGEYPYPVVQGTSGVGATQAVTIMFKEFGIRLNVLPTITPRGSVHLQVAPEVSSLDFTNAVTISGFQVPAISVRRVKTDVELQDGQSFAISGLLDNRVIETLDKIPFISSVPILGKFFQSISRTKSNTELIVIVTPEIVQPLPQGAKPPGLKYPQPFMQPNSAISPNNVNPPTAGPGPKSTMPVEKLIESLKPEQPLSIDSSFSAGSGFAANGSGMQAAQQ